MAFFLKKETITNNFCFLHKKFFFSFYLLLSIYFLRKKSILEHTFTMSSFNRLNYMLLTDIKNQNYIFCILSVLSKSGRTTRKLLGTCYIPYTTFFKNVMFKLLIFLMITKYIHSYFFHL